MKRAVRRKIGALAVALLAVLVLGTGCGSLFATPNNGVTLDTLAQRVDQLEAEVTNLQSQVTAMGTTAPSESETSTPTTGGAAATLAVVTADVLNVRQDPDINSQRVGVLMQNAHVTVEKVDGDWTEINFNNTLDGWVASEYLQAAKQ